MYLFMWILGSLSYPHPPLSPTGNHESPEQLSPSLGHLYNFTKSQYIPSNVVESESIFTIAKRL